MRDRPKVGLALGAGASRGLAHIGVLPSFGGTRYRPGFNSRKQYRGYSWSSLRRWNYSEDAGGYIEKFGFKAVL